MDDPTLSGFADASTGGMGNIVGYGGYARRRGGYNGQEGSAINPMQGLLGLLGQRQGQPPGGGGGMPMQIAQQFLNQNPAQQYPAPHLQPPQMMRPMGMMGGGYGPGLPPGGWSGGQMPSGGGYDGSLSAPLQALLSAHIRRMMSGQGGQQNPPKANFAQMLASQAQPNGPMGQPQQATPAPFGQPAQFGGQGPPGGGMRSLMANSPGP